MELELGETLLAKAVKKIKHSAVNLNILETWDKMFGQNTKLKKNSFSILCTHKEISEKENNVLIAQIRHCVTPKGGEVTARKNTIILGKAYLELCDNGKKKFLLLLAINFSHDRKKLCNILENYKENFNHKLEQEIYSCLQSPRYKLLKQFSSFSEGLHFLVNMRSNVLTFIRKEERLKPLEQDLYKLLSSWFDVGLLDLTRITWNSPASLLEKLINYEAVHAISSWMDLKNRLDSDRRCFAFFHYKMPNEPLIFVEVALTNGVSNNICQLLDEDQPLINSNKINTAVFYSISNAQKGLRGISLGNFLIKRVVEQISRELPKIATFVTLSPVPGFIRWLEQALEDEQQANLFRSSKGQIKKYVSSFKSGTNVEKARDFLVPLCAHYLLHNCDKSYCLDLVGHFHFSNGAQIISINWNADCSNKGLKQSAGIMVNYHYDLLKIDDRHEQYIAQYKTSLSNNVAIMLKKTTKYC